MALWQVGFFVLPKESIEYVDLFKVSDEYTFDDAPYWKTKLLDPSIFNPIGIFLPQTKSWSVHLVIYGDETSNRFEVFAINGIVESVSFRIDFTTDYESILRNIIEFCLLKDLIILDERLNILPLNYESIKNVIEEAPQVKKYNFLKQQSPK